MDIEALKHRYEWLAEAFSEGYFEDILEEPYNPPFDLPNNKEIEVLSSEGFAKIAYSMKEPCLVWRGWEPSDSGGPEALQGMSTRFETTPQYPLLVAEEMRKNREQPQVVEAGNLASEKAAFIAALEDLKSSGILQFDSLPFVFLWINLGTGRCGRCCYDIGLEGADPSEIESLGWFDTITAAEAEQLAKHEGRLSLRYLTELSDGAAKALANHKDYLSLEGLAELSDGAAKALANHKGDLSLEGLAEISDETAKLLSTLDRAFALNLSGLTTLSTKQAEELSKHDGTLILRGLTALSNEVAEILSKHIGTLHLRPQALDSVNRFKAGVTKDKE